MSWSTYTINADLIDGYEPDEVIAALAGSTLETVAKRSLRDRLRARMMRLVSQQGVTETAFYDGLAALSQGTDVRDVLDDVAAREYLYRYFADKAHRPGRGTHDHDKATEYDKRLAESLDGFVQMVEAALENDELSFSATRDETTGAPVWAI
jgi:hypothetical protein